MLQFINIENENVKVKIWIFSIFFLMEFLISFPFHSFQGQPVAHHPRTDRRERPLLPHITARERADQGQQAVPAAGLPERAPLAAQPGGEQALRNEASVLSPEPPVSVLLLLLLPPLPRLLQFPGPQLYPLSKRIYSKFRR